MSARPLGLRGEVGSTRTVAVLAVLAPVLLAAFLAAPRWVAAGATDARFVDRETYVGAVRRAFVQYWGTGERRYSAALASVVDFWSVYHAAKAASAALLLLVLVGLLVHLCRTFLRAGDRRFVGRATLAVAIASVWVLAIGSLVVTMANVQGASAPFAALLPTVTDGSRDAALDQVLTQVEHGLAAAADTGPVEPPTLAAMVDDFTRFHLAMAEIAAIVVAACVTLSVLLWKRYARTAAQDRRARRLIATFGLLTTVFSLVMLVIVLANLSTAADPVPALLDFVAGGW